MSEGNLARGLRPSLCSGLRPSSLETESSGASSDSDFKRNKVEEESRGSRKGSREALYTIMSKWYFYIARCHDESLYIGISSNTEKRIIKHNTGQGAQWIKRHGQAKIVYLEKYDTYLEAHRRELQVKKWSRKKKENLIKHKHPTKF